MDLREIDTESKGINELKLIVLLKRVKTHYFRVSESFQEAIPETRLCSHKDMN